MVHISMSKKLTLNELVKSARAGVDSGNEALMKTAHEQGIQDAERLVKVAGNQMFDTFASRMAQSLGFNPEDEVVKEASLKDLIDAAVTDAFTKIAEEYSPQTGGANLQSTVDAGADQVREAGKSHAVLAVQSANDALASIDMGDANTGIQSLRTAGENIELARQAAEHIEDPELHAQVAEAASIVSQAASAIQAQG
jgi:MFS superfamily sulfate permease-like transporter